MSDAAEADMFAKTVGAYGHLRACLTELLRELGAKTNRSDTEFDPELGQQIHAKVQEAWLAYGHDAPDVVRSRLDEIWQDFIAKHNVKPAPPRQHRHHYCSNCRILWLCGDASCDRVYEKRCPSCAPA